MEGTRTERTPPFCRSFHPETIRLLTTNNNTIFESLAFSTCVSFDSPPTQAHHSHRDQEPRTSPSVPQPNLAPSCQQGTQIQAPSPLTHNPLTPPPHPRRFFNFQRGKPTSLPLPPLNYPPPSTNPPSRLSLTPPPQLTPPPPKTNPPTTPSPPSNSRASSTPPSSAS